MSSKDKLEERKYMMNNPGLPAEMRAYFTSLDARLRANNIWATTTTTTTTTSSTTTTTTTD